MPSRGPGHSYSRTSLTQQTDGALFLIGFLFLSAGFIHATSLKLSIAVEIIGPKITILLNYLVTIIRKIIIQSWSSSGVRKHGQIAAQKG